jgi:hypothetical protein
MLYIFSKYATRHNFITPDLVSKVSLPVTCAVCITIWRELKTWQVSPLVARSPCISSHSFICFKIDPKIQTKQYGDPVSLEFSLRNENGLKLKLNKHFYCRSVMASCCLICSYQHSEANSCFLHRIGRKLLFRKTLLTLVTLYDVINRKITVSRVAIVSAPDIIQKKNKKNITQVNIIH